MSERERYFKLYRTFNDDNQSHAEQAFRPYEKLSEEELAQVNERFVQEIMERGFSQEEIADMLSEDDFVYEEIPDEDIEVIFGDEDTGVEVTEHGITVGQTELSSGGEGSYDEMYQEHENLDGTRHYEGSLGSFDYDPTQFQLVNVPVPKTMDGQEMPHNGHMTVLRYIGDETDGVKIQIPEGITNINMMFMNSKITSAPKIPNSVESMFATFASAHELKTADIAIPKKVSSAEFAFVDCTNLEIGPDKVPGNVKNANYMFAGCSKLLNTPKIGLGVQQGESMFACCEKLTEIPKVPITMREYNNMTVGCPGIDAAKDAQMQEKLAKDRAKYEKKLNRKGFLSSIGSGFAYAMQVHAMHQTGQNMLMSAIMVGMARKQGSLDNSFGSVVGTQLMARGGLTGVIGLGVQHAHNVKVENKKKRNEQKLQDWDNAHQHGDGKLGDLNAQKRARRDVKLGLFNRMTKAGAQEKNAYAQYYGGNYGLQEGFLQKVDEKSMLNSMNKQQMAKWYQSQISAAVNYYKESERAIAASNMSASKKAQALDGLREVSRMQMEPLMDSAERIHGQYKIFNEGDLRNISRMVKDLPSEKVKQQDFMSRNRGTKEDYKGQMHDFAKQAMYKNAAEQYANEHGTKKETQKPKSDFFSKMTGAAKQAGERSADRFSQAMGRFGSFMGNQTQQDEDTFSK